MPLVRASHTAAATSVPKSAAVAAAVRTFAAIAPTEASMRPETRAAGRRAWMSAVSASTSVAVLTVVPEKTTTVVGLPTFAQSTPASPVPPRPPPRNDGPGAGVVAGAAGSRFEVVGGDGVAGDRLRVSGNAPA